MENMFYNCTNLISINLESFVFPKITSLNTMFYGCSNLEYIEYINIQNFEENENINIDEMFYNIAPNAVICLSSCPPPTNFAISSMTSSQVKISWKGNAWNKYIISYSTRSLSNPDTGTKINVINREDYTFTNLNSGSRCYIYIKTDCGIKTSNWIGPLSVPIDSYWLPFSGTYSISTCSKIIYDHGGWTIFK